MELAKQIKKYRAALNLSQDEFAEKIYVTRQTVSNWENGKNYPDIHSILRMATLFDVSLDQLIKGDVLVMKEKIDAAEMRKLKTNTIIYGALLINAMLALYPLVHFLGNIGLATWGVQMIFAICFSIVVEKQKKKLNIQTYKEISAFFDGVPLDEIEKKRETEKRLLQRVLMGAGSMGIAIVAVILYWLLSWLLRV